MKWVQQILVYCVVLQLLASTWATPFAILDYQIRKDYISEYLCVNKDNVKLHCDGKCFLAKKLKQTSDHQDKEQEFLSKQVFNFFKPTYTTFQFDSGDVGLTDDQMVPFHSVFISKLSGAGVFRPPRV